MSQASTGASSLLRLTVASGSRRMDLVLPGAVPVAELVPELARSVGLLDGATVHGGYHLVTADGRTLAGDAGLVVQGVEDGGLITVTAGVDDAVPRVYDDVVEAMTDVVERDLEPWRPASGRRTSLAAAALLLALGAAALLSQDSELAALTAALVAGGLVTGALVLSRAQRETEAAVAVGWMGCGYAVVAGLILARSGELPGELSGELSGELFELQVVYAAAGVIVAGLACLVGLGDGRTLMIPPVVVGAVFLATGLVLRAGSFGHAEVLTSTLVGVVIAGSVFPWLALGATGTKVDQLFDDADITADPDEIDALQVAADARTAHEILVAISATVGLLLVLIGPIAVSLGLAGTLLSVACCLVVMLRTRQYRTGAEVLVGLVAGVLGLAATAVAVLWLHPYWRPTTALALAAAGALLLALTLLPSSPSIRRGRLGDLAESVGLLSLLPLVVVATGIFESIRS